MGMFNSTSTAGTQHHKTLIYGHHGYGKTFQCRFYADEYGKGLIISGESGLVFVRCGHRLCRVPWMGSQALAKPYRRSTLLP